MSHLKIIPGEGKATQGTRVFLDGKELIGITKLVLTAETNSLWQCELHFYPDKLELPEGIQADITTIQSPAKEWAAGKVDLTDRWSKP